MQANWFPLDVLSHWYSEANHQSEAADAWQGHVEAA